MPSNRPGHSTLVCARYVCYSNHRESRLAYPVKTYHTGPGGSTTRIGENKLNVFQEVPTTENLTDVVSSDFAENNVLSTIQNMMFLL